MSNTTPHFVISDVRIFDGHEFTEHSYVVVKGDTITAVGAGAPPNDATTSGAQVLSRPGWTLTPGLIDAHIHANGGVEASLTESIKFGVTTVLDMHNEAEFIAPLSALARDPTRYSTHADFAFCGYCAAAPGGWPETVITMHDKSPEMAAVMASWPKLHSVADVAPFIARNKALGARWIKLIAEDGACFSVDVPVWLGPELRSEVIAQAHAAGLRVVAHAMSHDLTSAVLREGVDGLAHAFIDKAPSEDYVALYKARGAHCNPTLTVLGSLTAEGGALQKKFGSDPLTARVGVEEMAREKCACTLGIGNARASVENAYASARALHAGGVPLVVGTDSTGMTKGSMFGLAVHHEMYLLAHRVGMTAAEVLRAATSTPAERFGLADRGRIAVGCKADLALFEGDVREHWSSEERYCLPLRCAWRHGMVVEVWKDEVASG